MRPTRSKSKSNDGTSIALSKEQPHRVFMLNKCLYEKGIINGMRLRHPGSEELVFFILDSNSKTIYELIQFQEPNRCWFIDDTVSCEGKLYSTVPFNKGFFIIYYLRKYCLANAVPINQIKDEKFPLPNNFIDDYFDKGILDMIADQKGSPKLEAYKYNKDKVLRWLAVHVKRLAKKFKDDRAHVSASAISANFVKSESIQAEVSDEEYVKYACGVVGNYIVSELLAELLKFFNIKDEQSVKRKIGKFEAPDIKKIKLETDQDLQSYENGEELKTKEKEKKATKTEKSLLKAAKGNKNIMSFFKKYI